MTEDTTKTAPITGASRGLGLAPPAGSPPKGGPTGRDARARTSRPASEPRDLTYVVAIPGDVTDDEHRRLSPEPRELGGLDVW